MDVKVMTASVKKSGKALTSVKKKLFFLGFSSMLFSGSFTAYADSDAAQDVPKKQADSKQKKSDKKADTNAVDALTLLPLISKVPTTSPQSLPKPNASAGVGDPGLSLRIKEKNIGDSFFYLKDYSDGDVALPTSGLSVPSTVRALPVGLNEPGLLLPVTDKTSNSLIAYNSSRVGVIFSPKDQANPYGTGFELALQSSMYLTVNHDFLGVSEAFLDREYAVGLSLGYYGFNLDASFHNQKNTSQPEYSGYGVGLSYSTKKLWTRLGYKDLDARSYSATVASLSDRLITSEMNSLELQAAYSLTNSVRLTGGLRYSIYGDPLTGNGVYRDNDQAVYLGTRWSF